MEAPAKPRIVVLISGRGSNLKALINAINSGTLDAVISCVISNQPQAKGLQLAQKAGVTSEIIDSAAFSHREEYDRTLLAAVLKYKPDLVLLAGFMRLLSPVFVNPLYGRIINIHPSLLPKFPGLHTHQRALDAGEQEAGVTVHFVSTQVDAGPSIAQARVPILAGDNAETLAARVLIAEHALYPEVAQWFCTGRLRCDDKKVYLDDKELPPSGRICP